VVDLIRPQEADAMRGGSTETATAVDDDLHGAPIAGLQWLVNAPRFDQVAMADDGYPVPIATIDPRAFALHKYWLGARADREALKRQRDREQAIATARIAGHYLRKPLDTPSLADLTVLPNALRSAAPDLAAAVAAAFRDAPATPDAADESHPLTP
jgi:hypothetical protein